VFYWRHAGGQAAGLVAGIDLRHPGVKLPGFGRIGVESPVATALAR